MLFENMILICSSQFRDKRTTSAIYHLLKGRRSIQTQQDAFLYELDKFYGVYKHLPKYSFDDTIQKMQKQGYLQQTGDSVIPGERGAVIIDKANQFPHLDYLNGMNYFNSDIIFRQRLLLLIQTLTNSVQQHFTFIPIFDKPEITNWVKRYYQHMKPKQKAVLQVLHNELRELLEGFPEKDAQLFVDCITGYEYYGMSSHQLAIHHDLDTYDVPLLLTAITHRMLEVLHRNSGEFPVLFSILKDLKNDHRLSQSAAKTFILLQEGYDSAEIASMRNLKINTIYDHIVEISLYRVEFPIEPYVSTAQQSEIITAIRSVQSFKLKDIKSKVEDSISYFQIRLVLAANKQGIR
ncbi:helix-turn-helix domain-containing protein [Virgibacillus siamensis]|uniref:helix-turn-helix domain-containing protein n=1 Tax=Virgibacillus siamensis TaxID=480071 RepID=UPI00098633DB|nr:helix-turn-helix domain-containing protein [Virgibacillus siamensis]